MPSIHGGGGVDGGNVGFQAFLQYNVILFVRYVYYNI